MCKDHNGKKETKSYDQEKTKRKYSYAKDDLISNEVSYQECEVKTRSKVSIILRSQTTLKELYPSEPGAKKKKINNDQNSIEEDEPLENEIQRKEKDTQRTNLNVMNPSAPNARKKKTNKTDH